LRNLSKKSRSNSPYSIDQAFLYKKNDDGKPVPIARRVEIHRRLMNIDTGKVTLELSFNYAGEERQIEISRAMLTRRKISNLLEFGVDVADHKVAAILEWLNFQEEQLPVNLVHSSTGFDFTAEPPIFKHYKAIGVESTYAGPLLIKPSGSFEGWLTLIENEVLGHPPLELALVMGLCAPVASYINHISGGEVLLIHLCGNSTQGKTTSVMLSISAFGNPTTGSSSLLNNWNGTHNAILAQLSNIRGLPVAFDEASMLNGDFGSLIYQLSSGKGKSRLSNDGVLQSTGQWDGIILSTGERSLSSESSKNAGLQIRIIELSDITWTKSAENANRLKEGLLMNHGFAGPQFINYLFDQGLNELVDAWKNWSKHIEAQFHNHDHFTGRLSDKISIIMTTAELINKSFGLSLDLQAMCELLVSATSQASVKRDLSRHAYDYLIEFIYVHKHYFYMNDTPPKSDTIWGKWVFEGPILKEIYIFPSILQSLMKNGGFENPATVLKLWRSNGLLDCESNKFTRKKAIHPSSNLRVHVIKVTDPDEKDGLTPLHPV
jgi:putative DNA primase/helicase